MNAPLTNDRAEPGAEVLPSSVGLLAAPTIPRGLAVRAGALGLLLAAATVFLVEWLVPHVALRHAFIYLGAMTLGALAVGAYVARALSGERSSVLASLDFQARIVGGVAEGIGQGLVVVDAAGVTVQQNAIHRGIFGPLDEDSDATAGDGEVLEADGTSPVPREDRPLVRSLAGEVVRDRRLFVRTPLMPAGRHLRVSSVPVRDAQGAVVGAVAMFGDLTDETVMAEKLRQVQRLDAIGQLTGGLAHDFNNLLTVILGNAGAVLASEAAERDPTLAADVQLIEDAARRGSDLTHRLLAFARRQTLNPVICDANVLVRDLMPLLERTLGARVRLTMSLYDEPVMVRVDVGELENALVNLSVNARDAMDGEGRITVITSIREPGDPDLPQLSFDGPVAVIAVADEGPGVPDEVAARVFEPFFTTKEGGGGSGLGLSMVHGFAHQSGGSIRVRNGDGGGARFDIMLPVAVPTAAESGARLALVEAETETMRVLVVEDDEHVGRLFRRLLERMGYAVMLEVEAEPALERFRAGERYDLLVSDIVLPGGMDGVALVEAVLERDPEQPVMMCSGYDRRALENVPDGHPVVEVLKKPFQPADFEAMVRRLIRRRSDVLGRD